MPARSMSNKALMLSHIPPPMTLYIKVFALGAEFEPVKPGLEPEAQPGELERRCRVAPETLAFPELEMETPTFLSM